MNKTGTNKSVLVVLFCSITLISTQVGLEYLRLIIALLQGTLVLYLIADHHVES